MQLKLKYIFISCALVALQFLDGCSGGAPISTSPTPERITFAGDGARGIFDPSIALDPGNGRLWMSYSSADPSPLWPANVVVVATHLAHSDDNGKTWIASSSGAIINNYSDATISFPALGSDGTLVNEVSQLIYDPGAAANERWKILWHHYLIVHNVRRFEHGWIAMKAAGTPEGLAAATEVKLFGGYLYDPANDTMGGTTQSPVGGAPQIQLDTALDAALSTCVFSEPGMYATNSALYMSLLCVHLGDINTSADDNHLIVLLKCGSPCNATSASSWSYLGTALNNADAASFGYDTGFSASGLFESGGNVYLVATPVQTSGAPWSDYYSGCRIFKFSDIDTATLQGSPPAPIGSVDGTPGSFNGACAYLASANMSGMLYSEINTSVTDMFQIYKSHINF